MALAARDPPVSLEYLAPPQDCLVLKVDHWVEMEAFLEVRALLQVPAFQHLVQAEALGTFPACRVPWNPLPVLVESLEAASAVQMVLQKVLLVLSAQKTPVTERLPFPKALSAVAAVASVAQVAPVIRELLANHRQEHRVLALAAAAASHKADRVLPVAVQEVHVVP